MIRRPPRSTLSSSSAASDVYKRQGPARAGAGRSPGRRRGRPLRRRRPVVRAVVRSDAACGGHDLRDAARPAVVTPTPILAVVLVVLVLIAVAAVWLAGLPLRAALVSASARAVV